MKPLFSNQFSNYLNISFIFVYLGYVFVWQKRFFSDLIYGDSYLYFSNWEITWQFIEWRYLSWSSRTLIDIFLIPISKNAVLFGVVNTLFFLLMPVVIWCLLKQFDCLKNKFWVVLALIMLYPMPDLRPIAGWVASLANYYYPMFFGFISLALISFQDKPIRAIHYFFLNVCLLIACNVEQLCIILVLVFAAQMLISKRFTYYFEPLLVSVCSLIYILVSPGNHAREMTSIFEHLPSYANYPFLYKLYLGFEATMQYYLYHVNLPFQALIFVLAMLSFKKWGFSLQLVPISLIFLIPFFHLPHQYVPTVIENFNSDYWLSYFYFSTSVSIFLYVNWLIFNLITDKKMAINLVGFMVLGFCARFVMGLTPAVFFSAERTFLFTNFAIIAVSAVLIDILFSASSENKIALA